MKSILIDSFKLLLVYLILCLSVFLMLQTIVLYTGFNKNESFLQYKQDYIHIDSWMYAFYIHVFSCVFCLFAGFTQFSTYIQNNFKRVHKWLGRMYVYNILLINFPVALIMAYYANGLLPTKIAFFILDILWFYFTFRAVKEIRNKNVVAHKKFMIRSFALTMSAISLRTWKYIIISLVEIDPLTLYMIDAWLGFVPNILVAELIIWYKFKRKSSFKIETVNHN